MLAHALQTQRLYIQPQLFLEEVLLSPVHLLGPAWLWWGQNDIVLAPGAGPAEWGYMNISGCHEHKACLQNNECIFTFSQGMECPLCLL